ncbi:MAG TPA: cysteine desulfurase family protein [Terracidiphilus sp.]|jgi:cysteine desulfurase
MRRVYCDANATTPLLPEVMEAMRPYWMEEFGNASSIHLHGQKARKAVDHARETLAKFFGCREAEVVFNSGGTEGDNTAIFGLVRAGDHFITTSIEHSAVLRAADRVAARGVDVTFVEPRKDGLIDPEEIRRAIRPATQAGGRTLISVMLANNETGVLQSVEEIGKIAAESGAFFHIDAVQGAGKIAFDVRRFGCHLCSISAHKMHGPKGVGAMYVRRGTPVEPLMVGGSHERRQRAGTENVPGIVGLGKAAELSMESLEDGTMARVARLRNRLEAGILEIPGTGVNGTGESRTANTTNIHFENAEGEALVIALDLKGVAVSGGSACHSGSTEPSHVLMAMGLDKNAARASLRFSLLKTVTDEDVNHVLHVVPQAVEHLRALAPETAGTSR